MSKKTKENTPLLNEEIDFKEVRCIGSDGKQYGIISSQEAQEIADNEGLDLVCVSPDANPPVCKIMDYGKYKYQMEKKKKEARKNQKIIHTKEIKLSVKIAQNDIDYKIKHAIDFLKAGNHVKFRVFLKGREMSHPEAGVEVLEKIWPMVEEFGTMEQAPKLEGRYVNMLVVPKKEKKK